jgi:hypothetical protein
MRCARCAALLLVVVVAQARARAGEPPRRVPRVDVSRSGLLSDVLVVRGDVTLVTAESSIPASAADVRFVPLPGSLAADVTVAGGHYELRAASSGTFAARVESPTHPELPAAELRVRFLGGSY